MAKIRKPKPVLWGIDEADDVGRAVHSYIDTLPAYCADNHQVLMRFLSMYSASKDTYQTYRRELERWVQWCWLVRQVDMLQALRDDVLAFLAFCKSPPHHWIGHKLSARFLNGDFHPDWHLFVIRKKTGQSTLQQYQWSESASKIMIATLSTFYTYCVQEQLVMTNPVQAIRQKKRLYQQVQHHRVMRKLSDHQWRYVIDQVLIHCVNDQRYERHLFVLSMFFLLGLRISELSVNDRHHPVMGDFFKITNYDGGLKRWGRVINGAKLQCLMPVLMRSNVIDCT